MKTRLNSHNFFSGIAASGSPVFFTNGVRHRGDLDLDSLLAAIEEAWNRATGDDNDRKANLNV